MLYSLGRLLQMIGLFVILPLAVAGQALDKMDEKTMLYLMVLGVVVFYVGWQIQQRAGPPR
jgi:hypothetical protein